MDGMTARKDERGEEREVRNGDEVEGWRREQADGKIADRDGRGERV